MCIGCDWTGNGFFSHSNCQRGRHLGKKVEAKDLSKELQTKLLNYINN